MHGETVKFDFFLTCVMFIKARMRSCSNINE